MLSIGSLQLASLNISDIYDASSNRLQYLANLLKQATFTAKTGLEQHVMTAFSEISTKAVDYATTFQSYSTIEKISVIALKVLIPLALIFGVVWCLKKAAGMNFFKSTKQPQNVVNQPQLPAPINKGPASPKHAKTPPPTPAVQNPLLAGERSVSPPPIKSLFQDDSKQPTLAPSTQSAPVSRASSPLKAPSTSIGGAGIPTSNQPQGRETPQKLRDALRGGNRNRGFFGKKNPPSNLPATKKP